MTLTVLQIIPALGTGGAEQACVDVAAALIAAGHGSLVVSSGGRRAADVQKAGATHMTRDVKTKNPVKIIRNALWLAALIRREKVDVVHARSRAPAWSAYLACKMTGSHYVTTFHAAYKFSNAVKKLYNSVMARADCCIAISPFIAAYMRDHYHVPENKIRLINRGIDTEHFNPSVVTAARREALVEKWGIDLSKSILLLPARLSPIKNHTLLLEAMILLRKQGRALPLLCFVGDDQGRTSYQQELADIIRREDLLDSVKLVGACDDMPAAYAVAQLVVMPSKVPEGFGRVPVEAMAMGVPVIASKLGATQETVVEGKTGWLLAPDDAQAWATKMAEALAITPAQRDAMAEASRARVTQLFSVASMVRQTLSVYDDLVRGNKSP